MNKKILLTLVAVVVAMTAMAQGRMDLRINGAMVQNDSSIVDEYGNHSAWIEIFNASHGTNAIEKMFITTIKHDQIQKIFDSNKTNKKNNQLLQELCAAQPDKIYEIPRGDSDTKIAPRKHVLFFVDGDSTAGTFHLPFKFTPGKENYIALYDVNGDLVDELIIPADLPANESFGRISEEAIDLHKDSRAFDPKEWIVRDGNSEDSAITPGKYNARPVNENIDKFHNDDPWGIWLTIMSMGVVFLALLMLYILFKLFGKAFSATGKTAQAQQEPEAQTEKPVAAQPGSNDEAVAAICMALYQHFNAHDEESGIITFNHDHELHSAWGSKSNLLLRTPEIHDHH